MNDFNIRLADKNDVPPIHEMMSKISSEIHNIDIFYADEKSFIRRHISDEGFILLATQGENYAGFLIVRFPQGAEDNLAKDSNQPIDPKTVFHIESVAVLPEFRGNGLQKRLVLEGERLAVSIGYQNAMATVSPHNRYSLSNMLDMGYKVVNTVPKYGSIRNILLKNFEHLCPDD